MRRRRWAVFGLLLVVVGLLTGCALFNQPPTANFTWNPSDPLARTDVQFTDLSTDTGGIVSWSWDFGDNDSSPSQNPKHEYEKGGTYQVRLTVTDGDGSSNTLQKTVTITPSLDGSWQGTLWDEVRNPWQLVFQLNHSATGGITGTAYVNNLASNILSASFDAATRKVRISFAYTGTGSIWLFVGTYDSFLDHISGYWENVTLNAGVPVGDWEVDLN